MERLTAIVFFYLLTLAWSQTFNTIRGPEYTDPVFLKTINNYFGCKTWNNNVCIECSDHYHFNGIGICCQINPQCKRFNQQVGICEDCYQGYTVVNGVCVISTSVNPNIVGCKTWTNGACTECTIRWYFDSNKVCQPVSNFCRTWTVSGNCDTCYQGYTVINGSCILTPTLFKPFIDNSLCSQWNNTVCIKCTDRAYFNTSGFCTAVSDQCATWDSLSGVCLTCYNGYNLNNGQCVLSATAQVSDLGCKIWDWNNKVCIQCSTRWVLNNNGNCVAVSDYCSQWNATGACTACYGGYTLTNGQCLLPNIQQSSNSGCKLWDCNKQICLQCSTRYVLNSNNMCIQVSDLCSQWDTTGSCTVCYNGYQLFSGQCQLVNSLCKTSTPTGGCATCYNGYILYQGNCTPISQLANIVLYYSSCCPQKLQQLLQQGRL